MNREDVMAVFRPGDHGSVIRTQRDGRDVYGQCRARLDRSPKCFIRRNPSGNQDFLCAEFLGSRERLSDQYIHHGFLEAGSQVGDRQPDVDIFLAANFSQHGCL